MTSLDTKIGLAQVGGAVFVAAVSSLPVLFLGDDLARDLTADIPPVIIGFIGYLIGRMKGRSRISSFFFGVLVLALGLLVAEVKNVLAGH